MSETPEMVDRIAKAVAKVVDRRTYGDYDIEGEIAEECARAAIGAMPGHLDEVREELRLLMLKTPTTSGRDTYHDGFHQGLAAAIDRIDAALATLPGEE